MSAVLLTAPLGHNKICESVFYLVFLEQTFSLEESGICVFSLFVLPEHKRQHNYCMQGSGGVEGLPAYL